jgi:hypothetical protein
MGSRVLASAVLTLCLTLANAAAPAGEVEGIAFFETKIRPVLVEHCYQCHATGAKKLRGGLKLDSRVSILAGGDTGPAVVPGKPEESLLLAAIRHEDELEMPPKGKLPPRIIADFERWITLGAPAPSGPPAAELQGKNAAARSEVRRADGVLNRMDFQDARRFWSLIPPADVPVPTVATPAWVRQPLDAFILQRLEAKGVAPSPLADKRTLIRRATFDLTGLPPSAEEIDAFLRDDSDQAFERVVDRLLASPHYGERWGRHWLDNVRYADTNGSDENFYLAFAWRYRDYVIRSLNDDKPYDRFVTEQLAGDLMDEDDPDQHDPGEALTGASFLAFGAKLQSERDVPKRVLDTIDEIIDVTSRTFLGLTVSCARCHDHKYDPIPQRDYYALAGIFRASGGNDGRIRELPIAPPAEREIARASAYRYWWARMRLRDLNAVTKEEQRKEREELPKRIKAEADFLRRYPLVHAMYDAPVEDVPIMIRGNHLNPEKEKVPRGFLKVTDNLVQPLSIGPKESGRLQLARWLTDPAHPLTARVMVNRIWQYHFGRGIVATASDFGFRGERPTHPELLDHLAREFIRQGWSIKQMHRLIMLSSTYQQSSAYRQDGISADPENRLLWRQNRRRLEAEAIRDSLLETAGTLDRTFGGSIFDFPLMQRVTTDQSENAALPTYRSHRRAIYLPFLRMAVYTLFADFDINDPTLPMPTRETSVVAPQALFMLNDKLVCEAAAAFADWLLERTGLDTTGRIQAAYIRAFGRPPSSSELDLGKKFLSDLTEAEGSPSREAWVVYCHTLLATSEFIYIN